MERFIVVHHRGQANCWLVIDTRERTVVVSSANRVNMETAARELKAYFEREPTVSAWVSYVSTAINRRREAL